MGFFDKFSINNNNLVRKRQIPDWVLKLDKKLKILSFKCVKRKKEIRYCFRRFIERGLNDDIPNFKFPLVVELINNDYSVNEIKDILKNYKKWKYDGKVFIDINYYRNYRPLTCEKLRKEYLYSTDYCKLCNLKKLK